MINSVTMKVNVDEILLRALKEDINGEDITTNAIAREPVRGQVQLLAKQDGIIAGLDVFKRVFTLLDETAKSDANFIDGDKVCNGDIIAVVSAELHALLSGERTALNYLQRMSGIATHTRELVELLQDSETTLVNTRKTTPNMRFFETYAVKVGGAVNHRWGLSDGILIKDNHISAAGGVKKAVRMAREYAPFVRKIEVEVEDLDMLKEALEAGADIIMLDNMDKETMTKAVGLIGDKAVTECSGNMTKEKLNDIKDIGVDYVSCGALTHSSPVLDFSLKNLRLYA